MALRIQVTGVGGQGVIVVARVLAQCAVSSGMHCVMSEVHGMSQRGGIVQSSVVIGNGDAAMIGEGQADLLIAIEASEALRQGRILKPHGTLVLNELTVIPPHLVQNTDPYLSVEDTVEWFEQHQAEIWRVKGPAIAGDLGSPKVMNSAILGTVVKSGVLPFDLDQMGDAIVTVTRGRLQEMNIAALRRGYRESYRKDQA